jgi:hypothetical protein
MAKRTYEVIRKATTFTQFGPSPDTVLSRHASYETAKKAFDSASGNIRLVEVTGTQRLVMDAAMC